MCIHFSHLSFTTEMDSSLVLNFAFPCGLRGFHVYKGQWNPRLNEKLDTIHKENNPHDRYAVAAKFQLVKSRKLSDLRSKICEKSLN